MDKVKSLGPVSRNRSKEQLGVRLEDGTILYDKDIILEKWRYDFKKIFNERNSEDYDQVFYDEICDITNQLESIAINNDGLLWEPTRQLNQPITLREIQEVISRLKPGKATGCDNLPNEILHQPQLLNFL